MKKHMPGFCPSCGKLVVGTYTQRAKKYCPHCDVEIIVFVRHKYIFGILFLLAMLPFLFMDYSFFIFSIHHRFGLYFCFYEMVIFFFAVLAVRRNVKWGKGKSC
jgi:hypothetical protein